MWIGTSNGLNRYDGFEVRVFTNTPTAGWSLGDAAISCLDVDAAGLLWVGTSEGLYVLDPESDGLLSVTALCPALPEGAVTSIYCSHSGSVFVSIKSDQQALGLFRVKTAGQIRPALQNNQPKALQFDAQNVPVLPSNYAVESILGAVADSVLLLKNKADQLFFFTEKRGFVAVLKFDLAQRLADTRATILWTGKTGYFFSKDETGQTAQLSPTASNSIFFRLGDHKTFLCFASKPKLFETNAINATAAALPELKGSIAAVSQPELNPVPGFDVPVARAIFTDRSGNVWIGTMGYGVRILKLNRTPFEHLFPNYSTYNFQLTDTTHVWMGKTHPNDLFERKTKKIEPAPWKGQLPSRFHLHNIIRDKESHFWMTGQLDTVSRVMYFNSNTRQVQLLPEQLKNYSYVAEQLLIDRHGNLWIGGHDGLCLRYRPGARQAERFSYRNLLPSGMKELRCNAVVQTERGDLFLGTSQGLIRLQDPNGTPAFSLYQHVAADPASLGCNNILSLYTEKGTPNMLWIGTKGGGLNRMDLSRTQFTRFTESDGLLNNVIYGILSDTTHKLWLSTNRGISLYDPATGICRNFQKSDGLAAAEFNTGAALQLPNGQLLFGSVDGLILLHANAFNVSSRPIPVAVTNIRVLGSPAGKSPPNTSGFRQNARLTANQNNLIFEFAGLDFGNPSTNRYRYRLLGLDDRWIYNGTLRTANYSGLSPGAYTFEVQAATAFGEWPAKGAQIHFLILAPWYRSWLAYIFYGLLLVLANLLYLRFREKQLQLQKTAELAQRESLRLQELDMFKNRILANITHEFRTPLTIILGLAERLRLGKQTDPGSVFTSMLQQGESMLQLLDQMNDLSSLSENKIQLNYRQGNISNYIRYSAESLRSLVAEKNINLSVHSEIPELVMDFDPEKLRQVIVNLLGNAIRHTAAGGNIAVVLSTDDFQQVIIRFSDTGEGIAAAELPHIFERFYQVPSHRQTGSSGLGLALTKELVSLMGGSIAVESEPGSGSTFIVQLPVTHNAQITENTAAHGVAALGLVADPETNSDKPVVVVIEDNQIVANYLHFCLASVFQVYLIDNGDSGISTVTEIIPDMVITDLSIPGKNGFEVVQTLKAQEITSHIPIVILSANANVEERIKGRRLGADAYLGKPFHEEELLLVIKNLMELRLLWQQRYTKSSDAPALAIPFPADMQDAVKKEDAFIAKIYAVFEGHYTNESFSLDDLCQALGYSKSKLQRKLAILTNQPAMHMLRNFRLQKAYELLKNHPEMNVSAVCFQVGFTSAAHFSRLFSKKYNVSPSEVRSGE